MTRRIYGENKRVSLVVIGMETYFRNLCTLQNRKHREAVLKTVATPADTQIKQGAKAAPMPKGLRNIQTLITRVELELFTIHLQIRCNLSVFYAETAEEFGDLIVRFTKSVCEAPYKQLKKGMSALKDGDFADLFCEADGGKGCKIERDGRGSLEVWRRM